MTGIGTRDARLAIDGVEYTGLAKCELDNNPGGYPTFGNTDPRDWSLLLEAAQDPTVGTAWSLAMGSHNVTKPYRYAPFGNTTASAEQPHYTGTLVVKLPAGATIGGAVNDKLTAVQTAAMTWPCFETPTAVTMGDLVEDEE